MTEPFHFHSQGNLAYLGDWKALYDRTKVESGPKGSEAGYVLSAIVIRLLIR